jgi:GntR family transcriptional regulator/MocR family aminotransferase
MLEAARSAKAVWRRAETFYPGMPAPDLVPIDTWRKLSDRRLAQRRRTDLNRGNAGGYAPLRTVIAEYLNASRGTRCTPDQVIVVSGTRQAFDLAARVLVEENEAIWVEDPGNPDARRVFEAAGAVVTPVPVDQKGLIVSEGVARAPRARLAYVTPSRHYPLGYPMAEARRIELLQWAGSHNSWIIEDAHDSDHRYSGRPEPALQGMSDGRDRVIHVGTFSNAMFASLRLGYMIVPDVVVDAFRAARALSDRHQSTHDQAVLTDFIAEGHFVRHVRRTRVAYAERQECLLDRLSLETDEFIRAAYEPTGMSVVGWLPPAVSDVDLARLLATAGIYAPPLSSFAAEPQPTGALILGYTGFLTPRIKYGAKVMGSTLRTLKRDHQLSRHEPSAFSQAGVTHLPERPAPDEYADLAV